MAKNPSVMYAVAWAGRILLGGVFIYAAVTKLAEPSDFVRDIDHYALLSYPLALAVGILLPWLELVSGIAVILRWRERGALLILLFLCGIFGLALASVSWRGLDINCGCFGHEVTTSSLGKAVTRDLGLGILAFFLLHRHSMPEVAR